MNHKIKDIHSREELEDFRPIAQIAGCDITQSSINTNFVGVSKARKSRLV